MSLRCLQCPVCAGENFCIALRPGKEGLQLVAHCQTLDCEGYRLAFKLTAATRAEMEPWPGMLVEGQARVLAEPEAA